MSMDVRIEEKLKAALNPEHLEVINESHLHAGHQGSPGTGESHYRVKIVSGRFDGATRLQRHRMVNEALAQELADGVHALAIETKTPAEAA